MITTSATATVEYPRPHFDRSHSWLPLVGTWEFAPDPHRVLDSTTVNDPHFTWPATIEVPYAWETMQSGVGRHWLPRGWYRTRIHTPEDWTDRRTVLHFGAVHHSATVWVDGGFVGEHEGGYLPFEFDITESVRGASASLVVRVDAPLDKREIAHGKQRSIPGDDYDGCSFTPTSGIWQPVWLEARPATHISAIRLRADEALSAFVVDVDLHGPRASEAEVRIAIDGQQAIIGTGPQSDIPLTIADPHLWEPDDPHLYRVSVSIRSTDGYDEAATFGGLRRIDVKDGRLLLNGRQLYVRGVLDQGYWPHTGATASDSSAYAIDIELARAAGYNLIRKHLKLEDPRFLHEADRRGMLVWAEPPSIGRFSQTAVDRFEAQIEPMVRRDGNHPCIVIWGLYNEEWGLDWDVPGDQAKQHAVRTAVQILKTADSSRPVVDNSGWAHVAGDLVDWHIYDEQPDGWSAKLRSLLTNRYPGFPVSIAVGTVVEKNLMADGSYPSSEQPILNSEYGGGYTSVERGWNLHWQTQELRRYDQLCGYVWTELYDIEHETAGIYTFDRAPKDDGGHPASVANAPTVIIANIVPNRPGGDITVDGTHVSLTIHISHHGTSPRRLTVAHHWGLLMETDAGFPRTTPDQTTHPVDVAPFRLSQPIKLHAELPANTSTARLFITASDENGLPLAATHIDIIRQRTSP